MRGRKGQLTELIDGLVEEMEAQLKAVLEAWELPPGYEEISRTEYERRLKAMGREALKRLLGGGHGSNTL